MCTINVHTSYIIAIIDLFIIIITIILLLIEKSSWQQH